MNNEQNEFDDKQLIYLSILEYEIYRIAKNNGYFMILNNTNNILFKFVQDNFVKLVKKLNEKKYHLSSFVVNGEMKFLIEWNDYLCF